MRIKICDTAHHSFTMHICKWHLHHTHICGFPHISGDILYKTTQAEIPWIHQLRYQIQHDEYFTMNGSAAWRAAFPPCPKCATQVRHGEMCCTRHMQCGNHTASNNAIQKVDECKINLHLVPSLASAALVCVYLRSCYFFTRFYIHKESEVFFSM